MSRSSSSSDFDALEEVEEEEEEEERVLSKDLSRMISGASCACIPESEGTPQTLNPKP